MTPDPSSAEPPDVAPVAGPDPEPLLRGRRLGRRPGGGSDAAWIWRGLELSLAPGDLVAVRGATGAGKSLLLRALAQLDPLDEGELTLLGRHADAWPPPAWRRRVAYLHQSPVLLPGTVEQNLRAPFGWKANADRTFDADRVLARVDPLGVGRAWLGRDAGELSGGERQIVALVRALEAGPTVLLLDEPTAALDPSSTRRLETLVRGWLEAGDGDPRAVLWVTHDEAQARRVGRRRLRLAEGRLREEES